MSKRGSGGNFGGIAGSGIFGMFGTVIRCNADDGSLYCEIMKIFNLLIVVFFVLYILYISSFLYNSLRKSFRMMR